MSRFDGVPALSTWLNRKTAHRRQNVSRSSSPVEALEAKILPAIDLTVSQAEVKITDDPPAGSNKFVINVKTAVKNLGTSPVDLTGDPNTTTDDIKIRVYGSLDATLDAGDNQVIFPDLITAFDNGKHILNQNEESTLTSGLEVTASQKFNYFLFFVDPDNKVAESNGNNNIVAVDVSKIEIVGGSGTVNAPKKGITPIDTDIKIRDLNTTDFKDGNFGVTVDGAQAKDKLYVTKSGTGADKLRVAGTHLKLGTQTIGTVKKVLPTADNNFQQSLQVEFTGSISRDQVTRLLHNVSLKPAKTSSGTREVHFQVKDNLENLSNVTDRAVAIQ